MLTRSRRSQGRPPALQAPAIPCPAARPDKPPGAGSLSQLRVRLAAATTARGSLALASHHPVCPRTVTHCLLHSEKVTTISAMPSASTRAAMPEPPPAPRLRPDPPPATRPASRAPPQTRGRTRRSRASRPGRTCALARAQPLRHRVSCWRECGAARQLPVEGPIRPPARRAGGGEGRERGATAPGRGRRPVERRWLRLPVDVRSRACRATEDMNNYMKKTYYNYTII